jgi:hypothetical protein
LISVPEDFVINGTVKNHDGSVMILPGKKTLSFLQEKVKKDEGKGIIICCEKRWRDGFNIRIDGQIYPKCWYISDITEDIVTIGPFLTWGHIDAGTSRLSVIPLGMEAMKIWIVARKR